MQVVANFEIKAESSVVPDDLLLEIKQPPTSIVGDQPEAGTPGQRPNCSGCCHCISDWRSKPDFQRLRSAASRGSMLTGRPKRLVRYREEAARRPSGSFAHEVSARSNGLGFRRPGVA